MWYKNAFNQSEFWNEEQSNDPKSLRDAFFGVITDSKTRTNDPYKIFGNLKTYKNKVLIESPEMSQDIEQSFKEAVDLLKSEFPEFNETSSNASGNWLEVAESYIGTPYKFGGNDERGIDCSAFIQKVFPDLPRTANEQMKVGSDVPVNDISQWQPGDRIYFDMNARLRSGDADHTGIYLGNNEFIQASSSKGVVKTPINDYYEQRILAVKR
jgi:cell wall-associated NlpC family hydrolase